MGGEGCETQPLRLSCLLRHLKLLNTPAHPHFALLAGYGILGTCMQEKEMELPYKPYVVGWGQQAAILVVNFGLQCPAGSAV